MITDPMLVELAQQHCAIIHLSIPTSDVARLMDPAIQEVLKTISEQGLKPIGPMFAYHHRRPSDTFDFDIGFPVERPIEPSGRVKAGTIKPEKVARTNYKGPYEGLAQAWGELREWANKNELTSTGRFMERYLTNPNGVPELDKQVTELNWVID